MSNRSNLEVVTIRDRGSARDSIELRVDLGMGQLLELTITEHGTSWEFMTAGDSKTLTHVVQHDQLFNQLRTAEAQRRRDLTT